MTNENKNQTNLEDCIRKEVHNALAGRFNSHTQPSPSEDSPHERIVITVNGRNQHGIVARLAAIIDEFGGDIRDISQTIVQDHFTMLLIANFTSSSPQHAGFMQMRRRLEQEGQELGIHIVAFHDDILTAMHSI